MVPYNKKRKVVDEETGMVFLYEYTGSWRYPEIMSVKRLK